MTSSTSSSDQGKKTSANVLAVLLPLWIIGGFFITLNSLAFEERLEMVHLWDRKIIDNEPKVVVFGNSIAKRDVNEELLATQLNLPKNKVQALTIPDSGGSLWYASLKNRVYENDVIPRIIVIVSDLSSGLGVEPLTEEDHRNLMAQLSTEEPLLSDKVFSGQSFRWLKIRQHRGDLREYLLHKVRDVAVGAVFAQNKNKLSLKGRAEVLPALERVFDAEQLDWDLHKRVIPITEQPDYLGLPDLPSPADSMLPHIIKLAKDHGSSVVFVRTPLAPGNNDDVHPLTRERDAVTLFNEMGAGYIDMRSLDLRDRHFEDRVHMNRMGSALFTTAFAKGLLAMGALEGRKLPAAILPITLSSVERSGEPPSIPSISSIEQDDNFCRYTATLTNPSALDIPALKTAGLTTLIPLQFNQRGHPTPSREQIATTTGCTNEAVLYEDTVQFSPSKIKFAKADQLNFTFSEDLPLTVGNREAYWVYPGTTITYKFEEKWDGDDSSFVIKLISEAFSQADAPPTIRYNNGQPKALIADGNRYKININPKTPSSSWELSVHSPADGPFLLIQGLTIGDGTGASIIVGSAADNRGAAIRLIGGMHTEGIKPVYPGEPPPLFTPEKIKRGNRMSALYKAPTFAYISDKATKARTPFGNLCSPIRVTENNRLLSSAHHGCVDVHARGRGRMCHQEENIYFSASDNTYPGSNERDYRLILDDNRQCIRAWWLYPQDRLLVRPSPNELTRFRDGLRRLELDAIRFADNYPDFVSISAILRVNGEAIIEDSITSDVFKNGAMTWSLDTIIPPGTTDIELELINPSNEVFWLITMASLSEYESTTKEIFRSQKNRVDAFPEAMIELSRTGTSPTIEPIGELLRTRTPCGYRFPTPYLYLSDTVLNEATLGRSSPLMLLENDLPLNAHATVKAFQGACTGSFGHTGRFIWFSPTSDVDAALTNQYSLMLHPKFPSPKANKDPIYWVYPGTTAHIKVNQDWNEELFGEFGIATQITVIEDSHSKALPVMRLGEESWPINEMDWNQHVTATAPEGDFELTIESPKDGPYLIIHHVGLGERQRTIPALITTRKVKP